jgi:hypothetical protein
MRLSCPRRSTGAVTGLPRTHELQHRRMLPRLVQLSAMASSPRVYGCDIVLFRRLESTSTSSGETISGPASLTAPPTASALMSNTGGSGPMGPKSLVHCEVPTAAFEALCQHRESASGVLQEAGFKKRGLAPCPRLPAFWTWVTDPSCNIPGCGRRGQEAGSRMHLKF